jgi:AmmeMemoRadiSam system protein A
VSREQEKKEDGRSVEVDAGVEKAAHGFIQDDDDNTESLLPALARSAVETFVRERRRLKPDDSPVSSILRQPAACFVSIKTDQGDLRGCIGTIEPAKETLAEELIANAVDAATRDPRFFPVAEDELQYLEYSVDVLFQPEPAEFEDLDPNTFGVIVEDESGSHRGLLLPDIEGIETASQQVEIATRKAGISPGTPLRLFRFRVRRFRERERFKPISE